MYEKQFQIARYKHVAYHWKNIQELLSVKL